MRSLRNITGAIVLAILALPGMAQTGTQAVALNIEAQPMRQALAQLAAQTGIQLIFPTAVAEDLSAPALNGTYTSREALEKLLAGSPLTYEFINERTVALSAKTTQVSEGSYLRLSQVESGEAQGIVPEGEAPGTDNSATNATTVKKEEEKDSERSGIPEILVTGSKLGTLNTDIRRTEDDAQPYVIFDRQAIERSSDRVPTILKISSKTSSA